jgi:iron complex transport system substrate-binding protein
MISKYVAVGALIILFGGCAAAERERSAIYLDDLGREVAVPAAVSRTLTLAPNMTELLAAAGGLHTLVAASAADDYPPEVNRLPRFSVLPVDFEAVVSLDPDVVFATDQVNSPRDTGTFESLSIPIMFYSFDTLDDIPRVIEEMGHILGTGQVAREAAATFRRRVEDVRTAVADLERPRVLFLVSDRTLYSFGQGSYVQEMIEAAGGVSVTDHFTQPAPVLSEEFVLRAAPDVIIGAFGDLYDPSRLLAMHPTWDVVPAVIHGRVYSVDPSVAYRPGPRVAEFVERIAHLLHPGIRTR